MKLYIITFAGFLFLGGCKLESNVSQAERPSGKTIEVTKSYFDPPVDPKSFKNLYEGNKGLAGIYASQLPIVDNAMEDYSVYLGRHPGTIEYHFWDGRICSVRYSPEGKILHREWSHHSPSNDAAGYTK